MSDVSDKWSRRIRELPPYLFAEIERLKSELRSKGTDVIDLSIGDPDLPTPPLIVERLTEAARNPVHHQYPSYAGSSRFRQAVSRWYKERFNISLDPQKEVIALIGSKEGIAHMPLAWVDPGEGVLVPNPGYPVYRTATTFAGGRPIDMPLTADTQFLPSLEKMSGSDAKNAKMMFLNYPNNPTSAIADRAFFDDVVHFAKKHDVLVCHDAAYTEVTLGGYEAPSFLQAKDAKDVAIEFHSLSKTFNMTGWRVGFAVGNASAVQALGKIKTNIDSGVPN